MAGNERLIILKINSLETILLVIFLFSLPFSETLKTISFILLVLVFLIKRTFFDKQKLIFTPLSIGLLIYLFSGLIITFFALDFYESLKGLLDIVKFVLVYIIFINEFNNRKYLIEWCLIISTTLGVIWGIIFWKLVLHRPHFEILSLGHFNHTSIFLGLVLVFTFCKILWNKLSKRHLILLYLSFILLTIGLILTTSRASILGLIVSFLFLLIYNRNKKVIFLFFAFLIISSFSFLLSKDFQRKALNCGSVIGRIHIWEAGLRAFRDHPIFGVGLRCFGKIDDKYYGNYVRTKVDHAHNLFINHLTQMGILGTLSLLILIFSAFLTFQKSFNNYRKIAAYASLIFVLVNGIFNTTLRWEHAIAFMIIAALVDYPYEKSSFY